MALNIFKKKSSDDTIALQLEKLKVNPISIKTGLTSEEVNERIEKGLVNKIENKQSKTIKDILFSNLFTVFNLLTFGIAIWLLTVESYKNLIFIGAVAINIAIGIFQEIKAKKKIEKLSFVSSPKVKVLRDSKWIEVEADQIVMDDVIALELGNQAIADCVVLKGKIEANESQLTGESDSIAKTTGSTIYSGSYMIAGDCIAQVAHVGKDNYIQKLAAQAKKYKKPKSEIMNSLKFLIRFITVIVIVIGFLLFTRQYIDQGVDYKTAVVSTAGGVIGMIPSGLFLLTSISLSLGVLKLSKQQVLVNDLYCIEMLARVNVLCLDKTGTITDGSMKVKNIISLNKDKNSSEDVISLLQGTFKENNPTAKALQKKFGHKVTYKAIATIPFSSIRKYSAASFKEFDATYILGAPEFVLKKRYKEIKEIVEGQAKLGYRVLLLAKTSEMIKEGKELTESGFTPICLVAIEDTIRKDAAETIAYFRNNGVQVKVISGDNPITVSNIAKRAGVAHAEKYVSLEGKLDSELEHLALKYNVFGRVTPAQKKRLVEIYHKHKRTVAMTGDGVNDILAMKESDCAIAMANGSEATRNVAHLVLMDSNFSSMPVAVTEGRRVINNIQRVATLFLTKTEFSFFLSIIVILLERTYPMQTVQLVLFDFLVISLPSMYLAVEPNNKEIKGHFLQNIIVSSLPGALLIVVNYLILIFVAPYLSMDNDAISTVQVITTTCMGLFVLFKVCKPNNFGRSIMQIAMWLAFAGVLYKFSAFFDLKTLNISEILLTLALILMCLSLYPWLNRTALFIKNWSIKKFNELKEKAKQKKKKKTKKVQ